MLSRRMVIQKPLPTYQITPSVSSVDEGTLITFTVTTTNVPNGTTLYWINLGTSDSADFLDGIDTGSFVINSNIGSFSRMVLADSKSEGPETLIIQVRTGSAIGGTNVVRCSTATINDTSTQPSTYYKDSNQNRVWTVSGVFSRDNTNGLYFNGGTQLITGSTLDTPPTQPFAYGSSNFTIECWFKTTASSSVLFGQHNWGSYTGCTVACGALVNQSNQDCMYFSDGTYQYMPSRPGVSLNTWHHFALVRNGSSIKIYLDGAVTTAILTTSKPLGTPSASFGIGCNGKYTGNGFLTGYIRQWAVHNDPLYLSNFTPPVSFVNNGSTMSWMDFRIPSIP
jgi:hypothetical protein